MAVIKFLLLNVAASLVNSYFLPIKEDPADALADEMVKGAGMDVDSGLGSVSIRGMNWKKPSLPDEPAKVQMAHAHKRFGPHDLVKLQPIVSVTGLVAPKEWSSTPETDASDNPVTKSEPVQSALTNDENLIDPNERNKELLHEIASSEPSTVDSEDSQTSSASAVEEELQNMQPKEVVKVSHHDTEVHQLPVKSPGRGLAHLGESVDKYGPVTSEKPVDSNFAIHHGHYRPTVAPTLTQPKQPKASEPAVASAPVAKMATSQQEPRNDNDLASSLRAVFPPKNKQPVAAPKPLLTDEPSKNKRIEPSPMESVHRSKRASQRFPIRPEDVRPAGAQAETTATKANAASNSPSMSGPKTTDTSMASTPVKQPAPKPVMKVKARKAKPSIASGDKLGNLFDANSVGGQMSADEMEKVLRFMKVQPEWNWHPFDLNGDGKLSRREFLNAAHVAERFKVHKK